MLLDYLMNSDLYAPDVFWETLLFAFLGLLLAAYGLTAVQAGVSRLLGLKQTGLSFNPLKLLRLNNLIFGAVYLLFGTAMIPAGKPEESRWKTALAAASVPAAGLLAGWVCVTVYASSGVIILRSLLLALATAFVSGGIFSLLPFPGLPGGAIVLSLLPEKLRGKFSRLEAYLPFVSLLAAGLLARSGLADAWIGALIARL